MHQSEIDRKAITQEQADQFYSILTAMFPGKVADFQNIRIALEEDKAEPDIQIGALMGSAYDWVHWGN